MKNPLKIDVKFYEHLKELSLINIMLINQNIKSLYFYSDISQKFHRKFNV